MNQNVNQSTTTAPFEWKSFEEYTRASLTVESKQGMSTVIVLWNQLILKETKRKVTKWQIAIDTDAKCRHRNLERDVGLCATLGVRAKKPRSLQWQFYVRKRDAINVIDDVESEEDPTGRGIFLMFELLKEEL
jgi:hypothetical protein